MDAGQSVSAIQNHPNIHHVTQRAAVVDNQAPELMAVPKRGNRYTDQKINFMVMKVHDVVVAGNNSNNYTTIIAYEPTPHGRINLLDVHAKA